MSCSQTNRSSQYHLSKTSLQASPIPALPSQRLKIPSALSSRADKTEQRVATGGSSRVERAIFARRVAVRKHARDKQDVELNSYLRANRKRTCFRNWIRGTLLIVMAFRRETRRRFAPRSTWGNRAWINPAVISLHASKRWFAARTQLNFTAEIPGKHPAKPRTNTRAWLLRNSPRKLRGKSDNKIILFPVCPDSFALKTKHSFNERV